MKNLIPVLSLISLLAFISCREDQSMNTVQSLSLGKTHTQTETDTDTDTGTGTGTGSQTCASTTPSVVLLGAAGNTLNFNQSAAVLVSGDVVVDSSDASAAQFLTGSATNANNIYIDGGFLLDSTSALTTTSGSALPGYSPLADPYASLPVPDLTTLTVQSTTQVVIDGTTVTLDPGIYEGGIVIRGGAFVTMNPGIYAIQGGLTITDPGTVVVGNNALLYDTLAGILIENSAIVELTAPTSGTYIGFSIFQDRGLSTPITISGNPTVNVGGNVYAAAGQMNIIGSTSIQFNGTLVLESLVVSGTNLQVSGALPAQQICTIPSSPPPTCHCKEVDTGEDAECDPDMGKGDDEHPHDQHRGLMKHCMSGDDESDD